MLKENFLKILESAIEEVNYKVHPIIKELLESTGNIEASCILLKNAKLAEEKRAPLCQDTGMVNIIIQFGPNFKLNSSVGPSAFSGGSSTSDIYSILEEKVREVYRRANFRASVVSCPINREELAYSPPIIQFEFLSSLKSACRIAILVRGGGVENSSRLLLLPPTYSKNFIKEKIKKSVLEVLPYSCPPVIVGIGIGGSADYVMYLSKTATILSDSWEFPPYVKEEEELGLQLKEEINSENIGISAWGEGVSVAALRVLKYPTHVGTLPVGIYLSCYATREKVLIFNSDF